VFAYRYPPKRMGRVLQAFTDRGRPAVLFSHPGQATAGRALLTVEEQCLHKGGLHSQLIRTGDPTNAYFRHDLPARC
jgi:hypothetical protein